MNSTAWHLDQDLADSYAAGRLDTVLSASVEQHLVACAPCRALMVPAVDTARLDAVWDDVLEAVCAPRQSWLERALLRSGLDGSAARLVAATPTLRAAWVTGVVVVLALALLAGYADPHGVAVFFALAPALPAAGVALAFGPASDPAHEIASATPYSAARLLALRTLFVVAATLVPATAAGLMLPGSPWLAVAWLLPGLALTLGTLVLSTRLDLRHSAAGLAVAWATLVLPGLARDRDPLLVTALPVQGLCLAVVLAAAVFLAGHHRDLPDSIRSVS